MRAVLVRSPGGPEVLELVDIDAPTAQVGEVEIRVEAFGLNRTEVHYRAGENGLTPNPELAPGIEAVGVIVQDDSGNFTTGQRVATVMGGMMFSRHGSYAEHIAVKAGNVVAIDADLDAATLAGLPEATLTVWGALDKNLGISAGETLLVRGASSGVGMTAVAYAKARGLTVIGTTRSASRADRLRQIGADHVLVDSGDLHEDVRALVAGGVHHVLELVGPSTLLDSLKATRRWGQVVVVGLLGGSEPLEAFHPMFHMPNTVRLSWFGTGLLGSEALPLHESPLPWVAEQVAAGAMPNLVAATFPVERIEEAHRLLESGEAIGKIVVTF